MADTAQHLAAAMPRLPQAGLHLLVHVRESGPLPADAQPTIWDPMICKRGNKRCDSAALRRC